MELAEGKLTTINIHKENMPSEHIADTGGEYAEATLDIFIDTSLTVEAQEIRLIHAILEHHLWFFPHDDIDVLTEAITDALGSGSISIKK